MGINHTFIARDLLGVRDITEDIASFALVTLVEALSDNGTVLNGLTFVDMVGNLGSIGFITGLAARTIDTEILGAGVLGIRLIGNGLKIGVDKSETAISWEVKLILRDAKGLTSGS